MPVIPLYREVLSCLSSPHPETVWSAFEPVYRRYRHYFDGLFETYGPEPFGPYGLPGTLAQTAPAIQRQLASLTSAGMEQRAESILRSASRALPISLPPLYLGTLFFLGPAATISIDGQPGMTLGMERFDLHPPRTEERFYYHPDEAEEMIPHEAAHVARMQILQLPPTPRRLSLLEMIMLEGTALTFTDGLMGRTTLATFLPADRFGWHRANDGLARQAILASRGEVGMEPFLRFFQADAPISGYYVGWSFCREYLNRYGEGSMTDLIALPSAEILRRLGAG